MTVQLFDLSEYADTYTWDFGDGQTASDNLTEYTYANEGTYTITLTTESNCGTAIATQTVTLVEPVSPVITANVTAGCAPLTVEFTAAPQEDGYTYDWSFPGGTPIDATEAFVTVVYQTAGVFDVILQITNAAGTGVRTEESLIVVSGLPTADYSFSNELGSGDVVFINESANADVYEWILGDGNHLFTTDATYTYTQAGTYQVGLVANNDCGADTAWQTVSILFPPTATFTHTEAMGCSPLTVTFEADEQGEGYTYLWMFEDGNPASSTAANPQVTFANPGLYGASLTVTNAAGSTTYSQAGFVMVQGLPSAEFVVNNTPGDLSVSLTASVVNTQSLSWNLGDGNTATTTVMDHTYEFPGTYTIILTVTNECGSTNYQQDVTIILPPTSAFTASNTMVCPGEMVVLDAIETGEGYTYLWNMEGGTPNSSTAASVATQFDTPGVYDVQLSVTNAAGTTNTVQQITVGALPTADFVANIAGLTATFVNNSTLAESFLWTFPDGSTATEMMPSFTFPLAGMYEVTLVATNACGSTSYTGSVNISGSIPMVSFTHTETEGCGPLTVQFTNTSANADSFVWSFPGGEPATSTEPNPVVTYNTPGEFTVTLTATNVFGSNALSQQDIVVVLPLATAGFDYELTGVTAEFDNLSTQALAYTWLFPDGTTATEEFPTYTFPGNGTYEVTLEVAGACNTASVTQTIVIDGALPDVQISTDTSEGCAPFVVTFTDLSTGSNGQRNWSFPGGEPATSSDSMVVVQYNAPGVYDVTLEASNIYGVTSQLYTGVVTVQLPPPLPTFTATTVDGISFGLEVDNPAADLTYQWDMGDGTQLSGNIVAHTYIASGVYTVTLTALGACGEAFTAQVIEVIINHVEQPAWATQLQLVPNPTAGPLSIHAEQWPTAGQIAIVVINPLGQAVAHTNWDVQPGNWQQLLAIDFLPAGTYWIRLAWQSETWTWKVVKL
ncbi:MAG: PKD domain-containing protein [Saprospiraceae bacterium]